MMINRVKDVKKLGISKGNQLTIRFYPFMLEGEAPMRGKGLVEIQLADNKKEIQREECFITEDAALAGAYIKKEYIEGKHFRLEEKSWKRIHEGIEIVFRQ